jgi:hypothetical protein
MGGKVDYLGFQFMFMVWVYEKCQPAWPGARACRQQAIKSEQRPGLEKGRGGGGAGACSGAAYGAYCATALTPAWFIVKMQSSNSYEIFTYCQMCEGGGAAAA